MGDFVQINVSNSQNDVVSFEKKFPKDITIAELKVNLEPNKHLFRLLRLIVFIYWRHSDSSMSFNGIDQFRLVIKNYLDRISNKLSSIFFYSSFNFQGKLEIITGASAGTMQLQLFNGDKLITQLNDDEKELGSYAIENGMRLHVVDNFQNFIGDEKVEKFDLTDKQYEQRRNTVRDYLKSNRLGKYNEEEMKAIEERKKEEQLEQEKKAAGINIGDRCLVTAKGPRRLGTIRYKGEFHMKPGIFIGVEYDEPLGIHDGTVDGHKYFECQMKYGSMVPIGAVEVGDFPRESDGLDDDEI